MYPDGIDAVWLATDGARNIAAFVTGGVGPIPDMWIEKSALLNLTEDFILGQPTIGEASMLVDIERPDCFAAMSERGLYVFDWADVHRTLVEWKNKYQAISRPSVPLSISEARGDIFDMAKHCAFERIDFSKVADVHMADFLGAYTGA